LFDLIVLDEASQMDTAHAILVFCALKQGGRVVLAGDDLQLAPIVKAEPPHGFEDKVGAIYQFYKNHHGIVPTMLTTNYRSNREIVEFGHCAGYATTLEAHSPDMRLHLLSPLPAGDAPSGFPSHLHWSPRYADILDPEKPVVCFVHDDAQSSQSNAFEADAVAAMIWLLRERLALTDSTYGLRNERGADGDIKPVSSMCYPDAEFWERGVGIVTPHKAQMGKIITALTQAFPQANQSAIRGAVDTVERYQGQERDVILCSFGLGDPDAIRNEDEFLYNLNRFNVMASRAKAKLIVLVAQTVVDHLSNDLDTLRSSRLLKLFADNYCSHELPLQFSFLDTISEPSQIASRSGVLKWL
jgi:DNA replication ATP-dependent helicase Dna2